jgi:hypothetical protein
MDLEEVSNMPIPNSTYSTKFKNIGKKLLPFIIVYTFAFTPLVSLGVITELDRGKTKKEVQKSFSLYDDTHGIPDIIEKPMEILMWPGVKIGCYVKQCSH